MRPRPGADPASILPLLAFSLGLAAVREESNKRKEKKAERKPGLGTRRERGSSGACGSFVESRKNISVRRRANTVRHIVVAGFTQVFLI